jgi:hypothetical protein
MADFRKWVLVLAVLAALVVPASAQVASCTVSSSNQPIRAEGLTEQVGQITLICTPTTGFTATTANFTAFFTTPVTNKIISGTTGTDVVLTNSTGSVSVAGTIGGSNSLIFNGVAVPATGDIFTISNVRVNANAVGTGGSVSVIMSASSPGNNVLFTGIPTAQVANVQTGLAFAIASGSSAVNPGPVSFTQCSAPTIKLVDLNFTEGFAASFKPWVLENGTVTPPGTATQGTRIFARFSGIPGNVNIAVPEFLPASAGSLAAATAVLVGFDATAKGSSAPVTTPGSSVATPVSSSSAFFNAFSSGSSPANPAFLVPSGGTPVYEITGNNISTSAVDVVTMTVAIQITPGVAVTSTSAPPTVSGGFAPISTVSTPAPTSGTGSAPYPRFVDVANQNKTLFSVSACVTNLLFPFVTNQAGFDTGVALINTSLDNGTGTGTPFATTPQSGTCTVYYFGSMSSGAATPSPQTTPTIAAGQMYAFALSAGGVAGSTTSAAGFQGYLIARCNFQFAHGYAFVSDLGAQKLAHGYLALVIPDRGPTGGRLADPFNTAGAGSGEQLVR